MQESRQLQIENEALRAENVTLKGEVDTLRAALGTVSALEAGTETPNEGEKESGSDLVDPPPDPASESAV